MYSIYCAIDQISCKKKKEQIGSPNKDSLFFAKITIYLMKGSVEQYVKSDTRSSNGGNCIQYIVIGGIYYV